MRLRNASSLGWPRNQPQEQRAPAGPKTFLDKIRGMMDEARRDAESLRAAERAAGQKEASDERDRAKRDIESAKDAALIAAAQRLPALIGHDVPSQILKAGRRLDLHPVPGAG